MSPVFAALRKGKSGFYIVAISFRTKETLQDKSIETFAAKVGEHLLRDERINPLIFELFVRPRHARLTNVFIFSALSSNLGTASLYTNFKAVQGVMAVLGCHL